MLSPGRAPYLSRPGKGVKVDGPGEGVVVAAHREGAEVIEPGKGVVAAAHEEGIKEGVMVGSLKDLLVAHHGLLRVKGHPSEDQTWKKL